jgi:hypothetical protein
MAATQTFTTSSYGSMPVSGTTSDVITGESTLSAMPDVPAAWAGALTTRTNDTSGTITMDDADHTISTGARVDIYWSGGQCYGAVVGTVAGTAVPIVSVTGGTVFPAAATDVIVCETVEVPLSFDGDNMKAVAASAGSARSYFVMNNGTYDLNPQYLAAGGFYFWHNALADTNPLAGELPTKVFISHADVDRTINNSIISVITGD